MTPLLQQIDDISFEYSFSSLSLIRIKKNMMMNFQAVVVDKNNVNLLKMFKNIFQRHYKSHLYPQIH